WDHPVVAGQSWGGNVVLQLAVDEPELVHGLALVDGGWLVLSDRWATLEEAWEVLAPPRFDGVKPEDLLVRLRAAHPTWPEEGIPLLLDTPYGFQDNADDITTKAIAYFRSSVGRTVTPLTWRRPLVTADLDCALTTIRTARSLFAGPGSPTYALKVWQGSGF